MDKSVEGVLGVSMEKIRDMVDVRTVIGEPISVDGVTLIPVSKVTYGFAGGGSDLPTKAPSEKFGGGSGAGVSITPIAFLSVANGEVKVLPIVSKPASSDAVIGMLPELVNKVTDAFGKKKDTDKE